MTKPAQVNEVIEGVYKIDLEADDVDALAEESVEEMAAVDLMVKLAEVRRDRSLAAKRASVAEQCLKEAEAVLAALTVTNDGWSPPKWLSPAKPKSGSHGTLMLLLSDMHFDEVVRPSEMSNLNAYSRDIATQRLERWAKNVVKLARDYLAGVRYDGFVLMMGGDSLTGNIHEELKETNEDTVFGSLLYYAEILAAALDLLLDEFGRGLVVEAPGNHGRNTRKPRAKLRARDNLDWLLVNMLAKEFKKDQRVDFQINDEADSYFEVYGRGQLLTHGDQVTGGAGIGGIWPPIKRMQARKAQNYMSMGKPFETMWLGHWHQYISSPGMVVNGAMKGADEYARINNFPFEEPQQALAVMTPEHGITIQTPVFCMDRKKEGW